MYQAVWSRICTPLHSPPCLEPTCPHGHVQFISISKRETSHLWSLLPGQLMLACASGLKESPKTKYSCVVSVNMLHTYSCLTKWRKVSLHYTQLAHTQNQLGQAPFILFCGPSATPYLSSLQKPFTYYVKVLQNLESDCMLRGERWCRP